MCGVWWNQQMNPQNKLVTVGQMFLSSLCLDFCLYKGSKFFPGVTGRYRMQGNTQTSYQG